MRAWVYDPHSGGTPIPPRERPRIIERINRHAEARFAGKYTRLGIRFKGVFCYIDAYHEPAKPMPALLKLRNETREEYLEKMRNTPIQLCRLRHFSEDRWSLGYFSHSSMRYEPSILDDGKDVGTLELCFESGAMC